MRVRKKPIEVEAWQWHRNGDLPDDNSQPISPSDSSLSEGKVVRYYRHPSVSGRQRCHRGNCRQRMHDHGWIDTIEGGHNVCPGDWVIRGVIGEFYPCKPKIFDLTYELLEDDE